MYSILICDDERDIVTALKIYLESEGYRTLEAFNGQEALRILGENEIHLVLLDVMMPVMDGITAIAKIREISNVPVIMLTAKSEDTDKILGLNVGADDYVTKPFNPVELCARVRSQLRRYMKLGGGSVSDSVITIGSVTVDDSGKAAFVDGEAVNLTPREYDILLFLMRHAGQVFPPKELYQRIWRDEPYGAEGTVAVHIRHLREKIEINPAEPRYIKAVWGQGYKFERMG